MEEQKRLLDSDFASAPSYQLQIPQQPCEEDQEDAMWDMRSVSSRPDDIQSLASSKFGEDSFREPAAEYLAGLFIQHTELLELCRQGAKRLDRTRFLRNNIRLLKSLYLSLHSVTTKSTDVIAIQFLRLRNSRSAISSRMYEFLVESNIPVQEQVRAKLHDRKDALVEINRRIKEIAISTTGSSNTREESQLFSSKPDKDSASEVSSAIDDDDYDSGDDITFDTGRLSTLKATGAIITSGQPFISKLVEPPSPERNDSLEYGPYESGLFEPLLPKAPGANEHHPGQQRSFYKRILLYATELQRPALRPGFERICWESALGKPLYIDIKPTGPDGAKTLQNYLKMASDKHRQNLSRGNAPSTSSGELQQPGAAHFRNIRNIDIARYATSSQSATNATRDPSNRQTDSLDPEQGQRQPHWLLLCITTWKSRKLE
ncbi:hypothetical protein F4860DRAFT_515549 [Xylaria cubensis]|nr:hypothetical protein F4860DRAFT_515549 [Xylaria cubensis]